MSRQILIQIAREQLEHDLLERVLAAERGYRNALAGSKQLIEDARYLAPDHPEVVAVLEGAAVSERRSLERYDRLLGTFTELVVNLRPSRTAVLNALLESAIDIVGADKGAIQVVGGAPGQLKLEAQRGFEQSFVDYFAADRDAPTACGVAFQTSRRVIVEDIETSPIFAGTRCLKVMLDAGLRTVQSTPVMGPNGQLLGIFSTHYCRMTRLSRQDLSMLDRISSQAALFIEAFTGH